MACFAFPKNPGERHGNLSPRLLVCVVIALQSAIRTASDRVFVDQPLGNCLHGDCSEWIHASPSHCLGVAEIIRALPPHLPLGMRSHPLGEALALLAESLHR